jgi:nucleoside 2-deoxyribosyltransferase
MRFYLAARYPRKEEMQEVAKLLTDKLGWTCASSWVFNSEVGKRRNEIACLDLDDLEHESDVLILFSYKRGTPKPGGGRWVEFGYALALNKPCIVIGNYENVFCHHPRVKVYPTIEDFISHYEVQTD